LAVPLRKVPVQIPPTVRGMLRGAISVPVTVGIDETGKVTAARVPQQRSSLATYLATIAKNSAEQWRFKPAVQNGRPVASDYTLVFRFTAGEAITSAR
jgi:outer membrane biosynthesis protein TonB